MTRAIVARAAPGIGRAIYRTATYHPYYKYARAVNLAARYGPTAYRMGRKIWRRYRAYKKKRRSSHFSKKLIGENIKSSNSKVYLVKQNNFAARDTRTLYKTNLTTSDVQGDNRNQRERGVVNFRGFRICLALYNARTVPIYFNLAVVSPKNSEDVTTANFFRSSTSERGVDFANGRNSLEFHCLPLNSDKFVILRHKRYRISPQGTGTGAFTDHSGRNYKNIDWYVPLKRQLRFDTTADTSPINGTVWLIMWADDYDAIFSSVPVANAYYVMERHLNYFRDTKT